MTDLHDDVYGGLPDTNGREDTEDEQQTQYGQLLSPAGGSSDAYTARGTHSATQQHPTELTNGHTETVTATGAQHAAAAPTLVGNVATATTTTTTAGSRPEESESATTLAPNRCPLHPLPLPLPLSL